MENTSELLYDFLEKKVPWDIGYMELAQFCLSLHCTAEGLPLELSDGFDKDIQASAFARFVSNHFDDKYGIPMAAYYGANFHRATEKGHWIEVIASIYKKGDTMDEDLVAEVRRKILS